MSWLLGRLLWSPFIFLQKIYIYFAYRLQIICRLFIFEYIKNKNKMRSPKNKFRVQVDFTRSIDGIGSRSSFTTNDISKSTSLLKKYGEWAKEAGCSAIASIYENKASYPSFDWQLTERRKLA